MILNIDAFDEFESSVLFSDGPASAAFFASYELIQRWMSGPERWGADSRSDQILTINI